MKKLLMAILLSGLITGFAQNSAVAATVDVDCDAGATIGSMLASLQPGDTLRVTGTCKESVFVQRQMRKITLDGQGKATIQPPVADVTASPTGPKDFAVFVEGTDITIKNFTILGGCHGIHLSGPASVLIERNIIKETGGAIHLDKGSIGQIIFNTIENNRGMGIHLQENSYARIGFRIPTLPDPMSNVIRNNAGHGIAIDRWSSAWIVGNMITGNKGHGIQVDRNSHADVVRNAIADNTGNALQVQYNSGVNLSSEGSDLIIAGPNEGTGNGGFGISCEVDGYVAGPQGNLTGAQGINRFADQCADRLVKAEKETPAFK